MVGDIGELEAWAMCRIWIVISGVDKEVETCLVAFVGNYVSDVPVKFDGAPLVL